MIPFRDPCLKCLVKACCKYGCIPKQKYDNSKPDLGLAIVLIIPTIFLITILIAVSYTHLTLPTIYSV